MLKSDLINSIAAHNPDLPDGAAAKLVEAFFECISAQLVQGGRVELRGFGSFQTPTLDARRSRNPSTGKLMEAAGKRRPMFRPSSSMFGRLNK